MIDFKNMLCEISDTCAILAESQWDLTMKQSAEPLTIYKPYSGGKNFDFLFSIKSHLYLIFFLGSQHENWFICLKTDSMGNLTSRSVSTPHQVMLQWPITEIYIIIQTNTIDCTELYQFFSTFYHSIFFLSCPVLIT